MTSAQTLTNLLHKQGDAYDNVIKISPCFIYTLMIIYKGAGQRRKRTYCSCVMYSTMWGHDGIQHILYAKKNAPGIHACGLTCGSRSCHIKAHKVAACKIFGLNRRLKSQCRLSKCTIQHTHTWGRGVLNANTLDRRLVYNMVAFY